MKIQQIVIIILVAVMASCSSPQSLENLNYQNVKYSGGNGKNFKKAIVIENAGSMNQGMKAIKHYLTETYGKQGPDWVMFSKGAKEEAGKDYYLYEIAVKGSKKTKIIYFDVTDFWGQY